MGWALAAAGSGGSGPAANPNSIPEPLGYGADGGLTVLTAGGAVTKGTWVSLGTAGAGGYSAIELEIGDPGSVGNRYFLDVRLSGSNIIVPDLFLEPGFSSGRIRLPLQVPGSSPIDARIQSSNPTGTLRMALKGRPASAAAPPGYSTMTALGTLDFTNTRPPAIPVAIVNALATPPVFTTLIASSPATFGALLAVLSEGNAAPGISQEMTALIGAGVAGSEIEIGRAAGHAASSVTSVGRFNFLMETLIPAGTRLGGAILAPAGDNAPRIGLYGFA